MRVEWSQLSQLEAAARCSARTDLELPSANITMISYENKLVSKVLTSRGYEVSVPAGMSYWPLTRPWKFEYIYYLVASVSESSQL